MTARTSFASLLVMVLIAALAFPALALLLSTNEATLAAHTLTGPQWFEYGTGTTVALNPSAADTYVDTQQQAGGDVELKSFIPGAAQPDVSSVPWWDDDWQARQCVTAADTDVHFVDVAFDSTSPGGWAANGWIQADYGDFRAVVWNGSSNMEADHWLATPFDTEDGHAFVTTDFGASTTRIICLYFGHQTGGLTSNSNPYLGQNWVTTEPIYEDHGSDTVYDLWVSNPTNQTVNVTSYYYVLFLGPYANTVSLAPGARMTYASSASTLYADGAVIVRGTAANGEDSLTPIFHSGTSFASRTTRSTETWCVYGTTGTTITITPTSGTAPNSYSHNAALPCITHNSSGNTLITSSAPVSITQRGAPSDRDVYPLYPTTTETLYGVPTQILMVGTTQATTATVRYSNTAADATLAVPATGLYNGGNGSKGTGPAMRITGADAIAAASQADSDGYESTSFVPVSAMSARYVLPIATSYVALACTQVNDVILVNGTPNTCAGSGVDGVGKLYLGVVAAGTVLESQSGSAFMAIYEPGSNEDESNMAIPRLNWADVATTPWALEATSAATGTWTTTASATTDIWGLVHGNATIPAGTSVTWEIACAATTAGPFTFDTVTLPRPLDHDCDDLGAVAVRATLTSNGVESPTIQSASVEHSMPVAALTNIEPATLTTGTNWLWRIHDDNTLIATHPSGVVTDTGTATGDYTVHLFDDDMIDELQVTATAPTATDGGNLVVVNRSTISVEVSTVPSGTDEIVWRTFDTVWAERTLQLSS